MNIFDLIIAGIILFAVVMAIRSIRKNGTCACGGSCNGNCAGCGMDCSKRH